MNNPTKLRIGDRIREALKNPIIQKNRRELKAMCYIANTYPKKYELQIGSASMLSIGFVNILLVKKHRDINRIENSMWLHSLTDFEKNHKPKE